MSGYLFGGVCFATAAEVASAVADGVNSHTGGVLARAAEVGAFGCSEGSSGICVTYTWQPVVGDWVPNRVVPIPDCTLPVTYADGLTLGWAVVAAWAMAYGIRFIANSIRGDE